MKSLQNQRPDLDSTARYKLIIFRSSLAFRFSLWILDKSHV